MLSRNSAMDYEFKTRTPSKREAAALKRRYAVRKKIELINDAKSLGLTYKDLRQVNT